MELKEFSSLKANLPSLDFKERFSELNYGSVKETSFPKQAQCLRVTYRKFLFFKTQSDKHVRGDLALNDTFRFTVRTSCAACSRTRNSRSRESSRIPKDEKESLVGH